MFYLIFFFSIFGGKIFCILNKRVFVMRTHRQVSLHISLSIYIYVLKILKVNSVDPDSRSDLVLRWSSHKIDFLKIILRDSSIDIYIDV